MNRLLLTLLLGALLPLICVSYMQMVDNGSDAYLERSALLREIRLLDTAIDRELLLLATDRRASYDALTSYTNRLTELNYGLLPRTADAAAIRAAMRDKADQIERFKSRLSVMRNSLRALLEVERDTLRDEQQILEVDRLIILSLLQTDVSPSGIAAFLRRATEIGLKDSTELRHMEIMLGSHAEVSGIEASIATAGFSRLLDTAAREVALEFLQARAVGSAWGMALAAACIVLLLLLITAVRRVWMHTREVGLLNAELEQRVEDRTKHLERIGEHLRSVLEENHEHMVSVRRLAGAMDQIGTGLAFLSADLKFHFCNRAYREIFELESEIVGMRHPDATGIGERFQLDTGNVVEQSAERQLTHGSRGELHLEETLRTINEEESTSYWLAVRDVTETRRLEASHRQSQKLESVGQLAAGIAHEINTPTQFISDNTHFLAESFDDISKLLKDSIQLADAVDSGKDNEETARQFKTLCEDVEVDYLIEEVPQAISQCQEGIARVRKIVQSMKEFSHPGGDLASVDINRSIENTLTVATNEWKQVAEVVLDLDQDVPTVAGKPSELNQTLLNLIVNAAHAIEAADRGMGTLTISSRACDGAVEIRIRDTGTGIPVAAREKLFEPFFTTKEVGKGTGQGLYIAHQVIVQNHRGELRFETELDVGTTFVIRLPAEIDAQGDQAFYEEQLA
ncbi:MAG: ATP-binding protein [Pseudomonadota bacterium]